jgi:cell division topological specificity factor
MSSFMDRFMGRKPTPAEAAKDRLKFVLVTDRTTISPEDLRKMQSEILDVIRKYCRVNEDAVDMKFEQRDRENYLVADIPLSAGRPDDPAGTVRIQTAITTSDDAKAEKPAETSSSDADEAKDDKPDTEDTKPSAEASASAEKSEDDASDEDQKKEDE